MSMQPPWPGQPEQDPQAHPANGQPRNDGWQQPQDGQPQQPYFGQPQAQPAQPHYGDQPYGQQQNVQQPQCGQPSPQQQNAQQPQYGQPYYGTPGGMIPNGRPPAKNKALPWVLAGGGVVVLAMLVGVVLAVTGILGGGNQAKLPGMVSAPTTSAAFEYPEGWVEGGKNVTVINEDGSQPAERYLAVGKTADAASAILIYEAAGKPATAPTQEQIRSAIDQGLQGQLDATESQMIYFRSTSGFGCQANMKYTAKPAIIDRDGMYGYSYGYACQTYDGNIEGIYQVAYDDSGVAHRFTIEALAGEWAQNRAVYEAMVASVKPNL